MSYIIVGLGNPTDKDSKNPKENYSDTRHNTGRMMLYAVSKEFSFDDFEFDKKNNALVSKGDIKKQKTILVAPSTYMNNSGKAVSGFVKSEKAAEKLIVIYDDFNIPLGKVKISFNRSSGGHNGLESIIKSIKTEKFIRIRVGIAREDKDGHAKVIHGDENIEKFILGEFKSEEMKVLKKVEKVVVEAVGIILNDGYEKASTLINCK